jgi:hypothetical protein
MNDVYAYIMNALIHLKLQDEPLSEYQKGKEDVLRLIFHMLKRQYKNNRPL